MSDFTQIRPVGAALISAGGQTYMTKVISGFRSLVNARENSILRVPGIEPSVFRQSSP